ncbi:hypothetical protein AMTRI_Chr11g101660 [Amborella trichopoda]|uniref:Uncharacterized protein n=2 Tax=Amborella trichopoda TaxID=13333 RepID=W1NYE4_AMBTC|nr:hypothetical protein AMTR_s00099p00064830 [Amborella trichopoda]
MVWIPEIAANAFLDTVKMCKLGSKTKFEATNEPKSAEFVSAMAAGIKAQTIVEISTDISIYTIALAVAARQTKGRLVCILPDQHPQNSEEDKECLKELRPESFLDSQSSGETEWFLHQTRFKSLSDPLKSEENEQLLFQSMLETFSGPQNSGECDQSLSKIRLKSFTDSNHSKKSIQLFHRFGLQSYVEFKYGKPQEVLETLKGIDFLLFDCKFYDPQELSETIDMNSDRSMVVGFNFFGRKEKEGGDYSRVLERRRGVKTLILPIGKGMQITKIGYHKTRVSSIYEKKNWRSKWVVAVDQVTAEEHFFRVAKPMAKI